MFVLLAEARIGAELKAGQERGEIATRENHGRGDQEGHVQASDKTATLPEIGIRQRARKMKKMADARVGAELGGAEERGEVATRADGTAIRDHAQGSGKVATLPEIGIPSQRASEMNCRG